MIRETLIFGMLLCVGVFSHAVCFADEIGRPTTQKIAQKYQKKLEKRLGAKFYHDPYYMKKMMDAFDGLEQEKKQVATDMELSVVLNEKDAHLWKTTVSAMPLKLLKKPTTDEIFKDPKGAFIDAVMNQETPVLQRKTMTEMAGINQQSIDDFLIMITESGTDIGAKRVPIDLKVK